MNDKEEIIAQIRLAVRLGMKPDSKILAHWANTLEQDEQQTTPSPNGLDCAGESSVQPTATLEELELVLDSVYHQTDSERATDNVDDKVIVVARMLGMVEARHAIREFFKTKQIEHEAKCHAAG